MGTHPLTSSILPHPQLSSLQVFTAYHCVIYHLHYWGVWAPGNRLCFRLWLLYLSSHRSNLARENQEPPKWITWVPHCSSYIVPHDITVSYWSGTITPAKMMTSLLTCRFLGERCLNYIGNSHILQFHEIIAVIPGKCTPFRNQGLYPTMARGFQGQEVRFPPMDYYE